MDMKQSFFILMSLVLLLGSGCVPIPASTLTPEQTAEALTFEVGDHLILRETILGVGGALVKLLQGIEVTRDVLIEEWESGQHARLSWTRKFKTETPASINAREAYKKEYANAPVGTKLPESPKAVYETVSEDGTLTSDHLQSGQRVLLPLFWQDEVQLKKETSLLWLSTTQYQELLSTRKTTVNLGLFDQSFSQAVGVTDQLRDFVEKIQNGSQAETEKQSVLQIDAEIDWVMYPLEWNGTRVAVRAIRAHNTFARYTILANEKNPLILEVILTPASRGSLNLLSFTGIREGFWGYEVTALKTKTTIPSDPSSENPPQPLNLKTPSDL